MNVIFELTVTLFLSVNGVNAPTCDNVDQPSRTAAVEVGEPNACLAQEIDFGTVFRGVDASAGHLTRVHSIV